MSSRPAHGNILAISGLLAEAAIARGDGVCAIAGAQAIAALQQSLLARFVDTRAVISFGIAGGLDRRLPTGTIVVARNVIAADHCWTTDQAWADAITARVSDSLTADIAATDTPVMAISAKERLHADTHAAAVDTESHIAARAAGTLGVPLAVLRVIADPADRALPSAALVALRHNGGLDIRAILREVRRAPRQIPGLLRTGLDTRVALRELARGRACLGSGLAYPDFGEFLLDMP